MPTDPRHSMLILTAMGMLGGLFTVAVQMPAGFDLIGRVTPQGWVMQGWRLAVNGSPVNDMLLPFLVMAAVGVVTFAIGARIFNRRFA